MARMSYEEIEELSNASFQFSRKAYDESRGRIARRMRDESKARRKDNKPARSNDHKRDWN